MNCERYKNKMTELHTKMGVIKINMDRMIIGSLSCGATSQCIDNRLFRDAVIIASVALAFGATFNSYKLYRLDKKCTIVQEIYYGKNKQKSYTINK